METAKVLAEVEKQLRLHHPAYTLDDVMPGTVPGSLECTKACTTCFNTKEKLHYHTVNIGTRNWSAVYKALYAYHLLERIKQSRNMPFLKLGMRVRLEGRGDGIIVGGNDGANLDVRFGHERHISNCHPQYEMVYFSDNASIIADYRCVPSEQSSSLVRPTWS